MTPREQIIYFDQEDHDRDGNGWNIVADGEAVALRFATIQQAKSWCLANHYNYVIQEGLQESQ